MHNLSNVELYAKDKIKNFRLMGGLFRDTNMPYNILLAHIDIIANIIETAGIADFEWAADGIHVLKFMGIKSLSPRVSLNISLSITEDVLNIKAVMFPDDWQYNVVDRDYYIQLSDPDYMTKICEAVATAMQRTPQRSKG